MIKKELQPKVMEYFVRKLGAEEYKRGYWRSVCPCPKAKDKKFGVNPQQDRTHCFVCGLSTPPIKLIQELEGLTTYFEVAKLLRDLDGVALSETIVAEPKKQKNLDLPEGYKNILIGDSKLGKAARRMLKRRGFDLEDLALMGVGYCNKGKYFGRIIIPFYENGRLVYFQGRNLFKVGQKFLNSTNEDTGTGKAMVMYNVDCLSVFEEVALVESVMNAWTWGDNSITINGKSISKHQLTRLFNSHGVKRVIIMLDDDGWDNAIDLAMHLAENDIEVKPVKFPENLDVNDLGKEETQKLVDATPWMDYQDVMGLYMELQLEEGYE